MKGVAGISRIDGRGKVYFVQSGGRPFVKIGWTVDVQARLVTLQCGNPDTLKLLAMISGTADDERGWHKRFAHLSVRNEWFILNEEMKAAISDRRAVAKAIRYLRCSAPDLADRDDAISYVLSLRSHGGDRKRGSVSGLDDAKVTAILTDDRSVRAIANDYGVGAMTIHSIRTRKTWRHVPDPRLTPQQQKVISHGPA